MTEKKKSTYKYEKKTLYCKHCGILIKDSRQTCEECGISRAGYSNWEDFNPEFDIKLNDELIFSGYRHKCLKFLEQNEIMAYSTGLKLTRTGKEYTPTKSILLANAHKYIGLKIVPKEKN